MVVLSPSRNVGGIFKTNLNLYEKERKESFGSTKPDGSGDQRLVGTEKLFWAIEIKYQCCSSGRC